MKRLVQFLLFLSLNFIFQTQLGAQFNNMYKHGMSDDHVSLVSTIARTGYVQASSSLVAGNWQVHLLKIDANGNPLLDITLSTPNQEHVTHVVQGNNNTYIVCGYETVGALDLGFVLSVDTNFNLINRIRINVAANNKHTPALNVMNSAFYLQPNNNLYFPGDVNGGYLITGFEAVGYNATDSKSGYAIKVDNNLSIQWAKKFDSPISAGQPDWDMCNSASWFWTGATGYFIGGSGTAPSLEQCALASLITINGNIVWKELYTDNAGVGQSCVAADCAYDDAELELYHLTNYTSSQSGGITAFNQTTGAINPARTRKITSGYSQDHYAYEFGATCAGNEILISGYGHAQTHGSVSGTFPFIIRYDKNIAQVNVWGAHYEQKINSTNYNPNATIFDMYQTTSHPRVFYPKLYAQRNTNEITLSAYENDLTFNENKIIKTDMLGKDSCGYFDPLFIPVQVLPVISAVDTTIASYNVTLSTATSNTLSPIQVPCQLCAINTTFSISNTGCAYTFTANSPSNICAGWTIKDISNNVIASSAGTSYSYTFSINGTYTICFSDCGLTTSGVICRDETCVNIQVNCPPPCGLMNADFSFTVSGCCVSFSDNTPDGNPFGCESWTFGTIQSVMQGDNITFCFPGSGTYNVCHNDCCFDASTGTFVYHQVCKTVTVNCTPPCCLPTGFTVSATGPCCRTFSANYTSGCTPGANVKYWWNFGDGNTSSQANPTHCYAGSGVYTVCVTVWCKKSQKVQFCQSVFVKCIILPPPCCIGTSKMNLNISGLMVNATDASETSPDVAITSSTWEWGDGSSDSGGSASHYYPVSGTYTITHTISGTSSGAPFTDSNTQNVVVHLAPACTCPPHDPFGFVDSPLQCSNNHRTCLKIIDYDGEAGTIYQWMQSTTADGVFTDIPNAIGQQVWINNLSDPMFFQCRCTSALSGGVTYTEVFGISDHQHTISATATPSAVCPGSPVTLTASPAGLSYYQWYPTGGNNAVTTTVPTATSLYEVFARNSEGCGALAEVNVTVNPCPGNDDPTTAPTVSSSGIAYPIGNCYNGTLAFANVSAQGNPANVLPAGGQDVWYKVVAISPALRVVGNTTAFNMVLELHDAFGAQIDADNDVSGNGGETMNTNGLTVGATYYIAVRSHDGSVGAFQVCIQSLSQSFCSSGSGTFDMCSNLKQKWTGASTYVFNFTPIAPTAGTSTSANSTNAISLSTAALALRHGGSYSVTIDAVYNLPDGEVVIVLGSTISTIQIAPHASVEVKTAQRCPATLLLGSILQGKPFVCGALYFTLEFQQISACTGGTNIGMPFTRQTAGPSATMQLNFSTPTALIPNSYYTVRYKPSFNYGDGAWGNLQVIYIGGSSLDNAVEIVAPDDELKSLPNDQNLEVTLYPNPNATGLLNVIINGNVSEKITTTIMDKTGRIILQQQFIFSAGTPISIHLNDSIAAGIYLVEIKDDAGIVSRQKLILTK
jgi:PKD repeat protein